MKKILAKSLLALLVAFCVVYLGDFAVWRIRVARGGGMGKVSVSRFEVAPLKNHKEEYYYDGTADVDCTQSLFPQNAAGACWYLRRNPIVWDR